MSTSIRADVFPTDVQIVDAEGNKTVYDKARVILINGQPERVYVYKDATDGPVAVFNADALSYEPPHTPQRLREAFAPRFITYTVETPGATLTFQKASGCGCGSRLKSFNPFPSITSLAAS